MKIYEVIFEKRALRELAKLDVEARKRIWNKLQDCKLNSFRFFIKFIETRGFKLRIGDWRVIADIDRNVRKIIILKVGYRKNVYDM